MADAELQLVFDGVAVHTGTMDARLVAQSLIAVTDLVAHVKEADSNLRNATVPDVRVAAFEAGSFDINLLLQGLGDVWEQVRALANGEDATAVVQLGTLVGFVVGAIRLHGNRKVRSSTTDTTGDLVEVEFEGGEPRRAVMSPATFHAFMDPQVRRAARRMIAPVEEQGVDSVTIASTAAEAVTVTKAEAANFRVEDPNPPPPSVTRRTARVRPLTINFNSEAWKVSEDAGTFTAKVEDAAFLRQLDDGSATIGKTDMFEVGLRIEQTTDANGKMKANVAIERIISHERGAVQPHLDFTETGSGA